MIHFRSPVKREGAQRFLWLTLISFAASVILTRIYLELTGYPSIGNGVLHIAHVLWGGLLLFVAALLSIIIANRWVYRLSAILTGIGVGLFIDEVGKFITRSNDYFFPFAAPIIYAFFLLVLVLYLEVRRPSRHNSRIELYHALDQIMELIENDLSARERRDLETRLGHVIETPEYPEHAQLAEALLTVIKSNTLHIADERPSLLWRSVRRLRRIEARLLDEPRYRLAVIVGLTVAGVGSLLDLVIYASVLMAPNALPQLMAALLLSRSEITGPISLTWFIVLMVLSGISGGLMVVGGFFMAIARERLGSELGFLGLLIVLTMVNLLLFYFSQFAALSTAVLEFVVLVGLVRYRQLYLGVGSRTHRLNPLADKTPGKIAVEANDE